MKSTVKRILACIMSFVMLMSIATVAGAAQAEQISKETAVYEHESNDLGYCIYCGKDTDPVSHCGHICHQGGVQGIIYKFLRVLWMVFRVNQYCECGMAHYGKQPDIYIGECIEKKEIPANVLDTVNQFNYIMNELIPCGTYSLHRLTDNKMSVAESSASGAVSSVINAFLKPTDDYYYIENGVSTDGISVGDIVSHADRECTLIPQGVVSVTVTEIADGYKTTIILNNERYYYSDGFVHERPIHHESCLEIPDYAYILEGGIKMEKADVKYSGATVEYTMDSLGRVTSLKTFNPFDFDFTASVSSVPSVSAAGEGTFAEEYYFTY